MNEDIVSKLRRTAEHAGSTGQDPWIFYAAATEIERLRRDCGEAYQIVGAMTCEAFDFDHPDVARALDNLSAATCGEPRPHDDLLPWPRVTK